MVNHRQSNAHEGLAREGKGGEEGDGSRIQMHHVDLEVRNHGVEEVRERRQQASEESVEMKGDFGGLHIDQGTGGGPDHRCLPLVGIGSDGLPNLVQPLLIDHCRPLKSWLQGWWGPGRGARLPLLPPLPRGHDRSWEGGDALMPDLRVELKDWEKKKRRPTTGIHDLTP